jgi:patatin-like phospholipase/acyl hydrolase
MKRGLVLDGGGVFGISQAQILARVDISKFDFFVGTSIGSVLSSACASGMDLTELPSFFHESIPLIFKNHPCYKYNIFNPKYPDKELTKALQEFLPDISFGELNKPVFVTAANLKYNKLKVFSSLDEKDSWWPLWEITRAATAAETYFKPWRGYADGGVFANNPSMVAIAAACKVLDYDVNDIAICSIGTGSDTLSAPSKVKDYSLMTWGVWLIKSMISGSSNSMHEYFAKSLPLAKYTRIQFQRKKGWKIDSPKDMFEAEKVWEEEIKRAAELVNAF